MIYMYLVTHRNDGKVLYSNVNRTNPKPDRPEITFVCEAVLTCKHSIPFSCYTFKNLYFFPLCFSVLMQEPIFGSPFFCCWMGQCLFGYSVFWWDDLKNVCFFSQCFGWMYISFLPQCSGWACMLLRMTMAGPYRSVTSRPCPPRRAARWGRPSRATTCPWRDCLYRPSRSAALPSSR